jgi:hypothetical protein
MIATPVIHVHLNVCVQSEVFEIVNEWTWLKRTGLLEVDSLKDAAMLASSFERNLRKA